MFVCIQLSRQLPAVARFAQSGARSPIVRRQVFCRNPGGRTCQVDRCAYLTSGEPGKWEDLPVKWDDLTGFAQSRSRERIGERCPVFWRRRS